MMHSAVESLSTWLPEQYQLLDFGAGRKLERFGDALLDRPSPAALVAVPLNRRQWSAAKVVQGNAQEVTTANRELTEWQVQAGQLRFNLKLTPFGHVGLFPEQISCWHWLSEQIYGQHWETRPEALNLFAYTGGSTLAMASAGANVVHVDASAPAVAWARRNAEASKLESQSIRWIVDDARKFVARELRREKKYDLVVLDPPSYGHGPKGKSWIIEQHMDELLQDIQQLLRPLPSSRLLITGHSECFDASSTCKLLEKVFPKIGKLESGRLGLIDPAGRTLDAGFYARLLHA